MSDQRLGEFVDTYQQLYSDIFLQLYSNDHILSFKLEGSFMDYNDLTNKPSINGVELTSDMDLQDIGILEMTPEMVAEIFLETFGYLL